MTTVGYGDITPDTNTGRFIAILVMVVGIGFLTLLIGSVSEKFLEAGLQGEVAEVESEVEEDIAAARQEILAELRAIGDRLKELEVRVERVVWPTTPECGSLTLFLGDL
jgi:voltage-gated potassium channel